MQKAGEAMKQIHGKLTVDKVDQTMYVAIRMPAPFRSCMIIRVVISELLTNIEIGTSCASKPP